MLVFWQVHTKRNITTPINRTNYVRKWIRIGTSHKNCRRKLHLSHNPILQCRFRELDMLCATRARVSISVWPGFLCARRCQYLCRALFVPFALSILSNLNALLAKVFHVAFVLLEIFPQTRRTTLIYTLLSSQRFLGCRFFSHLVYFCMFCARSLLDILLPKRFINASSILLRLFFPSFLFVTSFPFLTCRRGRFKNNANRHIA